MLGWLMAEEMAASISAICCRRSLRVSCGGSTSTLSATTVPDQMAACVQGSGIGRTSVGTALGGFGRVCRQAAQVRQPPPPAAVRSRCSCGGGGSGRFPRLPFCAHPPEHSLQPTAYSPL